MEPDQKVTYQHKHCILHRQLANKLAISTSTTISIHHRLTTIHEECLTAVAGPGGWRARSPMTTTFSIGSDKFPPH